MLLYKTIPVFSLGINRFSSKVWAAHLKAVSILLTIQIRNEAHGITGIIHIDRVLAFARMTTTPMVEKLITNKMTASISRSASP
jgi:hypothetical protein